MADYMPLEIILSKKTTELVLLSHKKTTKLVFLWPILGQKSIKVIIVKSQDAVNTRTNKINCLQK